MMENFISLPNNLSIGATRPIIYSDTFPNNYYSIHLKAKEWGRFLIIGIESIIIYGVLFFLLNFSGGYTDRLRITYPLITLIFGLSWWVFAFLPSQSYLRPGAPLKNGLSFVNLWGPLLLHSSVVVMILSALRFPTDFYPLLIQGYLGIVVLLIITRGLYQIGYQKESQLAKGNFVIAGANANSQPLAATLIEKWGTSAFMGTFDPLALSAQNFSENFEAFKKYCLDRNVEHIFITLPAYERDHIKAISQFATQYFIRCLILPTTGSVLPERRNIYFIGNIPVCDQWAYPLQNKFNSVVKRIFDMGFSLAVIALIFPWLIPIIGIAIKLSSPGPVFFVQARPGRRNKPFRCFKFRTMRVNDRTEVQAAFKDPRVTKVGQFLRKTSLDELPQFFNVLLGDMSIVGPRPNMISQLDYYSQMIPEYPLRHAVPPGITGYAQVKGYRGETKELYLMQKRVDYDLIYIKKWNFWLDLRIIFLTVRNMIMGEKYAY